ncbi:unnamed protein product [Sphagnum troendelagicum]|uniref:Methionyl/Valyl/Leucyl/Isoleucyl-tRNA synthetase anticodon-binding domain-containing protein n=1 Tax=Sphagnum troendelagicum TaxID=128251 RepID=A0ABP0T8S4_9BRYO
MVPFLLKFVDNLTNVYVQFNHKRLKGQTGEDDSRIALSTLYYVLLTICKAMAPFTPFFTETMFQNLQQAVPNSDDSVYYCPFPEIEGQTDKRMDQSVLRMMTVIDLGRNFQECHSKPLKTPLREMVVVHPDVDFLDDITGQLGKLSGKEISKAMGLVAKEVKSMTQAQIFDFEKAGEARFAGHVLALQDIKV